MTERQLSGWLARLERQLRDLRSEVRADMRDEVRPLLARIDLLEQAIDDLRRRGDGYDEALDTSEHKIAEVQRQANAIERARREAERQLRAEHEAAIAALRADHARADEQLRAELQRRTDVHRTGGAFGGAGVLTIAQQLAEVSLPAAIVVGVVGLIALVVPTLVNAVRRRQSEHPPALGPEASAPPPPKLPAEADPFSKTLDQWGPR